MPKSTKESFQDFVKDKEIFSQKETDTIVEAFIKSFKPGEEFHEKQLDAVYKWCVETRIRHMLLEIILEGKLAIRAEPNGEIFFRSLMRKRKKPS